MPIIAIANQKGGCGKSTLAVAIASALGKRRRVVLLDADVQGTAAEWGGSGRLPVEVRSVPVEEGNSRLLLEAIAEASEVAEVVVLDLPPHSSAVLSAALAVADLVVVPAQPSSADLSATAKTLAVIREAREVRGKGQPRCLLVPSRVDRRTASGREIEAALSDFGEPVGPAICQRQAHADAHAAQLWVGDFAPRSAAHTEIEALAALVGRMAK